MSAIKNYSIDRKYQHIFSIGNTDQFDFDIIHIDNIDVVLPEGGGITTVTNSYGLVVNTGNESILKDDLDDAKIIIESECKNASMYLGFNTDNQFEPIETGQAWGSIAEKNYFLVDLLYEGEELINKSPSQTFYINLERRDFIGKATFNISIIIRERITQFQTLVNFHNGSHNLSFNSGSRVSSVLTNTLSVGGIGVGNYTKIQDAVDNASIGDTVFVYDDSSPYNENIVIDKTINLVGENKDTTVIFSDQNNDVINIIAELIYVSGFTIRNGSLGINIQSTHCTIKDNIICSNNHSGIFLDERKNFIIDNKIIFNKDYGIEGNYSIINNLITRNIITDNLVGIVLIESYGNKIFNNEISNNTYCGIALLFDSNYNVIYDNRFVNNGLYIVRSYDNYFYNNTVNGNPLVYLEGEYNETIDDAGQVIIVNCWKITVQNLELLNVSLGIQLISSNSCKILNNNISSNLLGGIYITEGSCNNIIKNNNIFDNYQYGISLYDSENNTIFNNNILNNVDGVRFYSSRFNNIKNNSIKDNKWRGFSLINSTYNNITNNIINAINNTFSEGIYFYESFSNNISGNHIFNQENGIEFVDSENNIIYKNRIGPNNQVGLRLYHSDGNLITYNNITKNGWGISLIRSDNLYLKSNTISYNYFGIYLDYCNDNTIIHNNFINNSENVRGGWRCINTWDDGKYGNYWSDYEEKYPKAIKLPFKGIWSIPYEINENNTDNRPLIRQWSKSRTKTRTYTIFHKILYWFFDLFPNAFLILRQLLRLI